MVRPTVGALRFLDLMGVDQALASQVLAATRGAHNVRYHGALNPRRMKDTRAKWEVLRRQARPPAWLARDGAERAPTVTGCSCCQLPLVFERLLLEHALALEEFLDLGGGWYVSRDP
jgi:hypothetical protein